MASRGSEEVVRGSKLAGPGLVVNVHKHVFVVVDGKGTTGPGVSDYYL